MHYLQELYLGTRTQLPPTDSAIILKVGTYMSRVLSDEILAAESPFRDHSVSLKLQERENDKCQFVKDDAKKYLGIIDFVTRL